jgi:hypothetical protein
MPAWRIERLTDDHDRTTFGCCKQCMAEDLEDLL